MRIIWNQNEERFEAQFGSGDEWQRDQSAASASGFHTDGPPAWTWYSGKASSLDRLKKQIPSGIVVTRPALDAYNRLHAAEQKNEELKTWAKEQKKKLKKEQEHEKIEAQREAEGDEKCEPEYEARVYREIPEYWKGKQEITLADLPADILARFVQRESIPQRRAEPIGVCTICGDNLYYPEEPLKCWWCEGRGEEKFLEELI